MVVVIEVAIEVVVVVVLVLEVCLGAYRSALQLGIRSYPLPRQGSSHCGLRCGLVKLVLPPGKWNSEVQDTQQAYPGRGGNSAIPQILFNKFYAKDLCPICLLFEVLLWHAWTSQR